MSMRPISPLRRAWYRWKSLRLPWRTRFLVGLDLNGNTFWEFTDKLSPSSLPGPTRMRRILQPPTSLPYSEITSQTSPAWHQWLRHTRTEAPSLSEQAAEVARQEELKVLVARADERWRAKGSLLAMPGSRGGFKSLGERGMERGLEQALPALQSKDSGGTVILEGTGTEELVDAAKEKSGRVAELENTSQTPDGQRHEFTKGERQHPIPKEKKDDLLKRARGGPSEEWQPQAWDPSLLAAKR